jgi:gamma-glutamylcyclotransferase
MLSNNRRANTESWYFAYGSNLFIDSTDPRSALIRSAQAGFVRGFRLTFNKVGGPKDVYANMVFDPDSRVWGVAYLCDAEAMAKLDKSMGMMACRYRPILQRVETPNGHTLETRTYVAGKKFITKPWRPYAGYLDLVLQGARRHGLPHDYIAQIKEAACEGRIGSRGDRADKYLPPGKINTRPDGTASAIPELQRDKGHLPAIFAAMGITTMLFGVVGHWF